jgi:transcriptional regulator with XRE-family HTH domain
VEVSRVNEPTQRSEAKRLAALVNQLFETHRHPSGREYKLSEVATATNDELTTSWLSLLRKGATARPGADKIQRLADFFGVEASYFTGKQPQPRGDIETAEEAELRRVMGKPLVREMALRAGELDEEDQKHLFDLVKQALALGARARKAREQRAQDLPAHGGDEQSED